MEIVDTPLIINRSPKLWINTNEFRPVALGKEVCNAHPKSIEAKEWRKEQLRRIKYGFDVGGQHITGDMYFWLNFYKVFNKDKKIDDYPIFLDYQAEFCEYVELARTLKKGVVCLKKRQSGISNLMSSIAVRELWFNKKAQVVVLADGDTNLEPMKTYTSAFINELRQGIFNKSLAVDTPNRKQLGYQVFGDPTWKGQRGELLFRNFTKGKKEAVAGLTPTIAIFDEAGKAKGLIDNYQALLPALRNMSGELSGLPVVFGAVGSLETSEDLQKMFYCPDVYNCLAFKEESEKSPVGFFIEGWRMFSLDENGNSNKEEGTKIIEREREKVRKSNDERALLYTVSYDPLTPAEAFLDRGVNIFNSIKIKERIDTLLQSSELNKLQYGEIEKINNQWQFYKTEDWDKTGKNAPKGRFLIYEHPEYINGKIPADMYIIGADPIHLDMGTSMGGIYVFKRMVEGGQTLADLPVAEYLYRPSTPAKFAEDILKLCHYYNAIAMVEPSTSVVKEHFWHTGMERYLAPTPRIATNLSRGSQVKYGFPINTATKSYIIALIAKYIDDHIDNIFFPRLLKEMLDYNTEDNFDLIMALGQVLAYRSDLWDWKNSKSKPQKQRWKTPVRDSTTRKLTYE